MATRKRAITTTSVSQRLVAARRNTDKMQAQRAESYHERNLILAWMSRMCPSHLMPIRPGQKRSNTDWMWIVCVHSPMGQLGWHLPNTEVDHYFGHLERWSDEQALGHWDGSRHVDKLARLEGLATDSIARQIAANALGRPLPAGAQVHHRNGNHNDNTPSNLVVCENAEYHRLIHDRMREVELRKDIERFLEENPNELA